MTHISNLLYIDKYQQEMMKGVKNIMTDELREQYNDGEPDDNGGDGIDD